MAHNEILIRAGIDTVFGVLRDPRSYAHFVVGTRAIRRFDPAWPDPGSVIHHSVGIGPFALRDITTSVASEPPRRLVIRPRLWPFVELETVFTLTQEAAGTRLDVEEYAVGGPLARVWGPPLDVLVGFRNIEVLRRIAGLAERRAQLAAAEPVPVA